MNWIHLLKILLRGKAHVILKTLTCEMIHAALLNATSGTIVWIVWILASGHSTDVTGVLTVALAAITGTFILQLLLAPYLLGAASKLSYDLSCELRTTIGDHLRRLSLGIFKQSSRQQVADNLIHAINSFEFVLSHSLANISAAIFTPVILGIMLFWIEWQLAVALYAALLLSLFLQWLAGVISSHYQDRVTMSDNSLRARILEYIQGVDVLKNYGFENRWQAQLESQIADSHENSLKEKLLPTPLRLLPVLVLELGFLLMIALGNYLLLGQIIDTAAFFAMLLVGYRVYEPVKILFADYILLRQSDDQLAPACQLLLTPVMPQKEPLREPRTNDLIFNGVSFGYQEHNIINNFSLSIPSGSACAFVGPSGSGKSTLFNLLLRFWDPQQGTISIGGTDISQIDSDKHQSLLATAFQETWLFDDTVKNNVLFGNPGADKKQVMRALHDSGCLAMARQLRDGLDTRIGDNGNLLSGGQKQLIAIARAMLKNSPIILLDEASASLDPENENLVQRAIDAISHDKTLIIIAHKLNSIAGVDNIVVIENGAISEQGSHELLMAARGNYHRMWCKQQESAAWQLHHNINHKKIARGTSTRGEPA